MKPTAIRVENLGKRYMISHKGRRNDGLRHVIERAATAPFRWAQQGFRRDDAQREEFWAVRDVNFEVAEGEVVGIIGRNGAGKSTLLKLLSRITEQTEGTIHLRGRLASLLEVGTGFHPELTGRENIYLNGSILGMSRVEIKRKFDEIIAFAEIEKFLDTPVKRYSSGMYVRLAFAVAAHLEPEILVVDEVLAVGDMKFQRKCLGKMNEVSKTGRTVLFVSHNMATVARLCPRAMMLSQGRLVADGPAEEVISKYLLEGYASSETPLADRRDRVGNGRVWMQDARLLDSNGNATDHPASGQPLRLQVRYHCPGPEQPTEADFVALCTRDEVHQFVLSNAMSSAESLRLHESGVIELEIPALPLTEGTYSLEMLICSPGHEETYDAVSNAVVFDVIDGDFFGSGKVKPNKHWTHVGVLTPHTVKSRPDATRAAASADAVDAADLSASN
jgi:lipopolysaccharide transport system ATP-binding protein